MVWVRADYLLWRRSGAALPAVATASATTVPEDLAAVLGQPTTDVLAGGQTVGDGWRGGFALELGFWLDPLSGWAVAGDFLYSGRDSYGLTVGPEGDRSLGRPFYNVQTAMQDAALINFPPESTGRISVAAFDDFHSAGVAMRKCLWHDGTACTDGGAARVTGLAGYRFYNHDSLVFVGTSRQENAGPSPPVGTRSYEFDKFAGRSEFHGFELGVTGRLQRCRWWGEGSAALALGASRRIVFVEGQTVNVFPSNNVAVAQGALLTGGETNFGRYVDQHGAAIPRFRLGGGWQATERIGLHMGYNVI
ncbi:MAG TPA: BBP7 family outer membrane beta-barrel protein, partial [Lacipirellulaceae bacterium]|nr:BBP7 family outer membrane beta-barrel protein [Lacipirellulaceae bacterium]